MLYDFSKLLQTISNKFNADANNFISFYTKIHLHFNKNKFKII